MRALTGDLRSRANFPRGVEKIELYTETETTAFPADNIVLVARSNKKNMKIALPDGACVDSLTPKSNIFAECCWEESAKRPDHDVGMFLRFPVKVE